MNDRINQAVEALNARMTGDAMTGSAKFVVTGEGTIVIDASGARAADEETDVTLIAKAEVFEAIVEGNINPATAFMTGKLDIKGDVSVAMQLGRVIN
ncbi:SCP2 sterol-binding domain-containing protein [Roseovarius sp. D0-M9]|uniref:SCP2 sterol-binding domain-containing protein n=1 Tax=Roseovarius sp. D0-M9 TaxID=3127117 RepID=UPI00301005A4